MIPQNGSVYHKTALAAVMHLPGALPVIFFICQHCHNVPDQPLQAFNCTLQHLQFKLTAGNSTTFNLEGF
jgi:hypothetical protein